MTVSPKNVSLGENSVLGLILKFRVKSSVICVRLLLSHHVFRVKWFKALCYSRTLFAPTLSSLKTETFKVGIQLLSKCSSIQKILFCYYCMLKKMPGFFFLFFLFAFWEFIYYHIQVSATVPTYFLNALFEDVCTLSKKPAGMPQIVSVLFMTAK